MDNKTKIEPWPEPVEISTVLDGIKKEFVSYKETVRILTPLWLVGSFFEKDINPLKSQREILQDILSEIPLSERKRFLLLVWEIAHPRIYPLIDQRLAELPSLYGRS